MSTDAQTRYERFESFLTRLVAEPKAEIDAEAAERKAQPKPAPRSR